MNSARALRLQSIETKPRHIKSGLWVKCNNLWTQDKHHPPVMMSIPDILARFSAQTVDKIKNINESQAKVMKLCMATLGRMVDRDFFPEE